MPDGIHSSFVTLGGTSSKNVIIKSLCWPSMFDYQWTGRVGVRIIDWRRRSCRQRRTGMRLKLLKRRWRQGIGMRMQRRGVVPYTNQQQIATVTVASRSSHERACRFGKSEIRILHSSLAKASSANSAFSLTSAMSYRLSTPSRMGYGINRVSSNNPFTG